MVKIAVIWFSHSKVIALELILSGRRGPKVDNPKGRKGVFLGHD